MVECWGSWAKKLLCILVAQQQILYLLPDSSKVNRAWLGYVLPFILCNKKILLKYDVKIYISEEDFYGYYKYNTMYMCKGFD